MTSPATETPSEHFAKCGPFCEHVDFCEACEDKRGLCDEHLTKPNESISWAKETADDRRN